MWVPEWADSSNENTAGRIVDFWRILDITSRVTDAVIHFSADTRYKLFINDRLVSVGPTRGSTQLWYYDTLNITPYLKQGRNKVQFLVLRYFAAVRGAMPFARTAFPGFTVTGLVRMTEHSIDMASLTGWTAQVQAHVDFPLGLIDDWCLHVSLVMKRIVVINADESFLDQRTSTTSSGQRRCESSIVRNGHT